MNLTPPLRVPMYANGQMTREWTLFFVGLASYATGRLITQEVDAATADYAAQSDIVLVGYTATGSVTLSLLSPASYARRVLQVNDTGGNASVNNITVDAGASTINGAATYVMNVNYESLTLYCDGTEFFVI